MRNFRSIGDDPVIVDLDQIVVLVGPNNVGKTSILLAYSSAIEESELKLDDFHGQSAALPVEIELHSEVSETPPAKKWVNSEETGRDFVRERWTWTKPGKPQRHGFNVETQEWDATGVPWGAANVAKGMRAKPHRVTAFDDPEEQAKQVVDLLSDALVEQLRSANGDGNANALRGLFDEVRKLREQLADKAADRIRDLEQSLTSDLQRVFPGFAVRFEARRDEQIDAVETLFSKGHRLLAGTAGDEKSFLPVELHGSGARRTLLWVALRLIAERAKPSAKKPGRRSSTSETQPPESTTALEPRRSHVLLMDEPELCLHPSAVRDACNALYELPATGNWQVLVTTHSPLFVDISRDNTTIVRVERRGGGAVSATTVFRPDRVKLDDDERNHLKLMNVFEPQFAEFFFGGSTVVVEGDTEYTAFRYVILQFPEDFRGVHIVRARGKDTICLLIKILNQFSAAYGVLHDSDRPETDSGKKNSAWSANTRICAELTGAKTDAKIVHRSAIPNFEEAVFGKPSPNDKPYRALQILREDPGAVEKVRALLALLIGKGTSEVPGIIAFQSVADLEAQIVGPSASSPKTPPV